MKNESFSVCEPDSNFSWRGKRVARFKARLHRYEGLRGRGYERRWEEDMSGDGKNV